MAGAREDPPDGIVQGRMRRAAPIAGLAARTTGEAVITALRRRSREPEDYARRAERYVELLGRSKGALMKAGQILSFVPFGSLPEEGRAAFQAAMSRLQADAPPMAPALAAAVIEEELGARPEQIFVDFSPRPVAAASIGQVHTGHLPDGRRVAVKVQYPGVAEAIRADLANTELLALMLRMLRSLAPGLTRIDPKQVAAEISERIGEEIDYRNEARNQMFFADAYRGHPFIRVPEVLSDLSTGRVLTQEWADGMAWPEALGADQGTRDRWGEVIFRFVFSSLRRLCAFNADPHPGNYKFHPDGSVSFLDFGCVKYFSRPQVTTMQNAVRAVVRGDGPALVDALTDLGLFAPGHRPSPEDAMAWWRPGLEALVGPQPFPLSQGHVARVIETELSMTGPAGRVNRVMDVPRDFVFMSRIDMGLMSVLAELRACGPWRSIQQELDEGAGPETEMGRIEAGFWFGRDPLYPERR
jgi:predicted unusual protein kinase regulating ubiquinone biosynthesis (AarF/ABC1/UbiB family)